MRTRLVGALAMIVIGSMVGLLTLPGASYAASATRTTTGSFANNNTFTSSLGTDWRIGDCNLFEAINPSYTYVRLTPPDSNGNATLTWGGVAQTTHTNNADIWWTTFTFITAFGSTIVTSPTLRGVDMQTEWQIYSWSRTIDIRIDPALYFAITQVRWSSSC
ncbi:MAG: hypothetical protein QOE03_1974 [Micromonosporaceae bacterium]|jgi:hypothetical protein|nr:hypothetical protein [Micromonosporaceae bacterium]